jgi:Tfp pilus assembly protein FimV
MFARIACIPALLAACLLPCAASHAESKRIEVYPLSQHYVDTRAGDTLGEIAARLLPNNPRMQQKLMDDILRLNPDAFIERNPDQLLADTRLWLPNHLSKPDSRVDSSRHTVETFSWGNIKKPR